MNPGLQIQVAKKSKKAGSRTVSEIFTGYINGKLSRYIVSFSEETGHYERIAI